MTVSVVGDLFALYVEGRQVYSFQDKELDRGMVSLGAFNGKSLFKNVEYQILDADTPTSPNVPPANAGTAKKPGPIPSADVTKAPALKTPTFEEWDLAKPLGTSQWTPLDGGVLHGGGRGWLATKQDYSDFEMSLEYQLPSGGNSGVFVRASPSGNPDGTEFLEIALVDDKDAGNRNLGSIFQTGSLWKIAARKQTLNTVSNQWHTLLVRAVGPDLQVTHDGTEALNVDLSGLTIPASVKRQPSGRIGLQSMTTAGARFRNITIRDLAKVPAPLFRELATFKGHSAAVLGVALIADGTRLASGSADTTIKMWDTTSGKETRS